MRSVSDAAVAGALGAESNAVGVDMSATSTSTNINLSGIFTLPNGNMLIEFAANTNKTYTIIYSDNMQFSNAMIAPPAIAAPANIVQWIDYGPPTTLSAPTNSSTRFYRVFQNP